MKPKRPRKNKRLFFGLISIFIFSSVAFPAEEVIYKGSRPMKPVFKAEENGVEKSSLGEESGGEYYYDPRGKTDPFESFIAKMEAMEDKKKRKPKTYLETLDISQLELIAIIVGPKGNWAMVREAKGTGHVIKKGTAIGTRGGVVYSITDKEVKIREEYKDYRGRIKERFVSKKVPSLQ